MGNHLAYLIRYEDGRDAVSKIYSDLDLSRIIVPGSDGEETNEEHESAKAVPTKDVRLNKRQPLQNLHQLLRGLL